MNLSSQQRQQLQSALVNAFPSKSSLEQMLSFGLNKNLNAIAGDGNLEEIIFSLIKTAESEGWTESLVRVAREKNPGNLQLQHIAQELLTDRDDTQHPPSQIKKEDSNQQPIIQSQPQTNLPSAAPSANPGELSHKHLSVSLQEIQNPKSWEIVSLSSIPVKGDEASSVKANYTKLREFLKERRFDKADDETAKIMLWIAKREDDGWLRVEDLKKFPNRDLCTIDRLWLASSNGKFGFSVQKQIWINLGGKPGIYDSESFQRFLQSVEWDSESKVTFDDRAKKGHLPLGLYVKTIDNARLHQKWSASMDKYDPLYMIRETTDEGNRRRRWQELLSRLRWEINELQEEIQETEKLCKLKQSELKLLQREINELQKEIQETEKLCKLKQSELKLLQQRLEKKTLLKILFFKQISKLQKEIQETEMKITWCEKKQVDLNRKISEDEKQISKLVKEIQETEKLGELKQSELELLVKEFKELELEFWEKTNSVEAGKLSYVALLSRTDFPTVQYLAT